MSFGAELNRVRYDTNVLSDRYEVLDGVDEEGHGVKVASGDFDDEFELV